MNHFYRVFNHTLPYVCLLLMVSSVTKSFFYSSVYRKVLEPFENSNDNLVFKHLAW